MTDIKLVDNDRMIERDRLSRELVLLLTFLLTVILPAVIGHYTFNAFLPAFSFVGTAAGLGVGGVTFAYLLPKFIIVVPQVTAFVTINPLLAFFRIPGDPNVVYGPGTSIAYPWEIRDEIGNLSLQIITLEWTEAVPGTPSELLVKGSIQFKVDIENGSSFLGVDESTIRGGVVDIIKADVSQYLAGKSIDAAKRSITALNKDLTEKFSLNKGEEKEKNTSEFEKRYGIQLVAITASGVDNPEHVQKTLDALAEAAVVAEGVSKMYGIKPEELARRITAGEISINTYNEMIDRWLVESDKADMNIQVYKGLEGVARVFGSALSGSRGRRN